MVHQTQLVQVAPVALAAPVALEVWQGPVAPVAPVVQGERPRSWRQAADPVLCGIYPLVNIQKPMENHHF